MVVEVIKPSPIVGLNVVETTTGVVYITDDGKYLLQGPIYDMSGKNPVNISNQPLMKKVEALKDEMIIFKAPQEKHVVTVFTDISCGYCKLHESVGELNSQGVTVRYLAYPRQGADSDVGKKMASIWCNGLQQKALTQAFKGEEVAMIEDCKIDLSKHMSVGNLFKVRNTSNHPTGWAITAWLHETGCPCSITQRKIVNYCECRNTLTTKTAAKFCRSTSWLA